MKHRRDSVNEEILTFFAPEGEEQCLSSCHDLFLHTEIFVAIEDTMGAVEVDARDVFPLRQCGRRLDRWFTSYEEVHGVLFSRSCTQYSITTSDAQ
jgi:hypothetical protein